jgi:hypothetical protein
MYIKRKKEIKKEKNHSIQKIALEWVWVFFYAQFGGNCPLYPHDYVENWILVHHYNNVE